MSSIPELQALERRLLLSGGSASIFANQRFDVGSYPQGEAAADMNGDGLTDLVFSVSASTDAPGGNGAVVLLSRGDGSFAAPLFTPSPQSTKGIVAADLNGDGRCDVAATSPAGNSVFVFLNSGVGVLSAPLTNSVGTSPGDIRSADLDADGDMDLAISNTSSSNFSILKNNGDGTFAAAVNYGISATSYSLALADLDRDGDFDVATANFSNGKVSIFKNNGSGTFALTGSYRAYYNGGTYLQWIAADDMDKDGDLDLVTVNQIGQFSTSTVSIVTGDGTGAFTNGVREFSVGDYARSGTLADLNKDGALDLIVSDNTGVRIMTNDGAGTLATREMLPVGSQNAVALDVDRDSDIDIAALYPSGHQVTILQNDGNAAFGSKRYPASTSVESVAAGDWNRDGDQDLVVFCFSGFGIATLSNDGTGRFVLSQKFSNPSYADRGVLADMDGDSDLDILAVSGGDYYLLANSGSGQFSSPSFIPGSDLDGRPVVIDMDRDGDKDVVSFYKSSPGGLAIIKNNGSSFSRSFVDLPGLSASSSVTAGDFDADGDIDLASYIGYDASTYVLLNNGDGTFASATRYYTPRAWSLVNADFDGDGDLDLVGYATLNTNGYNNSMWVLKNSGGGVFSLPAVSFPAIEIGRMFPVDVDRDGDLDVIGGAAVLLNRGDGTFDAPTYYGGIGGAIADFDGDGDADSAIASGGDVVISPNLLPPDTTSPQVKDGQVEFSASTVIRLNFNENVAASLSATDMSIVRIIDGTRIEPSKMQFDPVLRTATFWLATLSDGNYRATLPAGSVTDAAGNPLAADYSFDFFVFKGDANRDRVCDVSDLALLAAHYGTVGNVSWADGDFNGDGVVDVSDLALLAANYGQTLPAPAAPLPSESVTAAVASSPVVSVTASVAGKSTAPLRLSAAPSKPRPPVVRAGLSAAPRIVPPKPEKPKEKAIFAVAPPIKPVARPKLPPRRLVR